MRIVGEKVPFPCVLVTEFNLSYHNRETILFTIDPYCGNLNLKPQALKGTHIGLKEPL